MKEYLCIITMKKKQPFITPAILQDLSCQGEHPILAGSIVNQTTITSTGQEIQEYNGGDPAFNQNWE